MTLLLQAVLENDPATQLRLAYDSEKNKFSVVAMSPGKVALEFFMRAKIFDDWTEKSAFSLPEGSYLTLMDLCYRIPHTLSEEMVDMMSWMRDIDIHVQPVRGRSLELAEIRFCDEDLAPRSWVWKDSLKNIELLYE